MQSDFYQNQMTQVIYLPSTYNQSPSLETLKTTNNPSIWSDLSSDLIQRNFSNNVFNTQTTNTHQDHFHIGAYNVE